MPGFRRSFPLSLEAVGGACTAATRLKDEEVPGSR